MLPPSALVALATVGHSQDKHEQLIIMDLVDDAMDTGSHPPLSRAADKWRSRRRPRVFSEELDDRLDPASDVWIERAELADSSG